MDADRIAKELRRDFERWSRWAMGVLGFCLATSGSFAAVGLLITITTIGGTPVGVDLAVILLAAIIAMVGVAILVALWQTGRRLLGAITWWMRLSHRSDNVHRGLGGWLQPRIVNFEPPVFARVTTATIALLVGIGGLALVIRDIVEGMTSMTAAAGTVGVISTVCGIVQAGGVMRIVSGLAEGDPLWARIRSRIASR